MELISHFTAWFSKIFRWLKSLWLVKEKGSLNPAKEFRCDIITVDGIEGLIKKGSQINDKWDWEKERRLYIKARNASIFLKSRRWISGKWNRFEDAYLDNVLMFLSGSVSLGSLLFVLYHECIAKGR